MRTQCVYQGENNITKKNLLVVLTAVLAGCARQRETPPKDIAEQHLRDQFCGSTPVDYGQTEAVNQYGISQHVVCHP